MSVEFVPPAFQPKGLIRLSEKSNPTRENLCQNHTVSQRASDLWGLKIIKDTLWGTELKYQLRHQEL